MRYAYIDSLRDEYAIVKMCHWLQVSRSGYYKWRCRGESERSRQTRWVEQQVIETFKQFKRRYGAPRLTIELNESGIRCCRNHIAKLMAANDLKAKNGKGYKYFPSFNAINHVSDNF